MGEKPILFSGPLVRAILEGRKTQTRRVAKLVYDGEMLPDGTGSAGWEPADAPWVPGDRLWVRESWRSSRATAGQKPSDLTDKGWPVWYRADNTRRFTFAIDGGRDFMEPERRWRPSIHMPRWASRITLRVTGVRAERLQETSEADAKAEGVEPEEGSHALGFRYLWDEINAKRAPWASNPWVWVVSFETEANRG